jgi:purine nucleosidase
MAVLLDPALSLSSSRHRVTIETASELTRGMTVVDRLNVSTDERNRAAWSAAPNPIDICWEIDITGWKSALFTALQ